MLFRSIFVEDVARANIAALQSEISDDVFNIASGVETSLNKLATMLLRVMNSDLKPEYGPERKVNPVPRRLANVEKAEKLMGFKSGVSLEEGLIRLVAWWRQQRSL